MALFQKKIGTIFLKEESEAENFISRMQELLTQVNDSKLKSEIEKQIKMASYGDVGEKKISFELKNSGMDMYVLHDIYLEFGEMSAQIDYLVITRRHVYVLECKNLIGNIEIDNGGNFVRTYELFGKKIKEGIYSPITQNERHLRVIKELRKDSKSNFIMKQLFERNFGTTYKSVVVLANPKTFLNAKFAKKEVKSQVIRADQLITYIRESDATDEITFTDKDMYEVANFFIENDKPRKSDYAQKYEELVKTLENSRSKIEQEQTQNFTEVAEEKEDVLEDSTQVNEQVEEKSEETKKICPRCGDELVLRTSTKGTHAGNQFYGCSRFPKCRYIENI